MQELAQANLLENELELNKNITNNISQNNFLNSTIWKTIDTGIDIGIRALLPDIVEDQAINIKDNLIKFGLKDGIKKTINDAIEFGKSALGLIKGDFKNISQIEKAIKNGGIIDKTSELLDFAINKTNKKGIINNNVANILRNGKNIILNNVERNIEKEFSNQYKGIENLNKYISNWKQAYEKKDFSNMEKEYNKIENVLKKLVPLETTLLEARKLENMHNFIKNNGKNFNLSEAEKNLIEKL